MEQEKIERINALARKHRAEGLTEEETAERAALRREYIDAVKSSLELHLDNTYVVDRQGNKRKLEKRGRSAAGDQPGGDRSGRQKEE